MQKYKNMEVQSFKNTKIKKKCKLTQIYEKKKKKSNKEIFKKQPYKNTKIKKYKCTKI